MASSTTSGMTLEELRNQLSGLNEYQRRNTDELRGQLTGLDTYQRKSDAELRTQAEGLYNTQYDRDLRKLQQNIELNVAQQNRSALDNGMQRSSYNQAQQAIIRSKGLESQYNLAADYEQNVANALYQLMANEDTKQKEADQYRNQLLLQLDALAREDDANARDADKYKDQLLMSLYEYGQQGSKGGGSGSKQPQNENTTPNLNLNPGADNTPFDLNGVQQPGLVNYNYQRDLTLPSKKLNSMKTTGDNTGILPTKKQITAKALS